MELPHHLVSTPSGVETDLSLVTATRMPQLSAIYHLNFLIWQILMSSFPILADLSMACCLSCSSTESYSPAHASSHILFDLSSLLDSNKTLADWIRPLAVELPHLLVSSPGEIATRLFLVSAPGMLQLRAIDYSIGLHRWILMSPLRTISQCWL